MFIASDIIQHVKFCLALSALFALLLKIAVAKVAKLAESADSANSAKRFLPLLPFLPCKFLHGDLDVFGDIANIATFASVIFPFFLRSFWAFLTNNMLHSVRDKLLISWI